VPAILCALVFRSNNSRHRPVIEALGWLSAYGEDRRNLIHCAEIPIDGVVSARMQDDLSLRGQDPSRRRA
jgi:hypothetical protein